MSQNSFRFWDITFKLYENVLNKEEDVLLLFIHWHLVKNDFLCIGLGDNEQASADNSIKSELLPQDWNTAETYAIRYLGQNQKIFILRGVKSETEIIFNFVRAEDLHVTGLMFNCKQEVKSLSGNDLNTILPNCQDISLQIQTKLIVPQLKDDAFRKEISTQTKGVVPPSSGPTRYRGIDPLMIGLPRIPHGSDLNNYGRSDLDPLSNMRGPAGGGMLFDPFTERGRIDPSGGLPGPRLPRGAVPPGARFDPFGPPDPDRDFGLRGPPPRGPRLPGSGPNPDMLPPGYDDMFM